MSGPEVIEHCTVPKCHRCFMVGALRRKRVAIRITRFQGGRHYYVRMAARRITVEGVASNAVLAEAMVDRHMATTFSGLVEGARFVNHDSAGLFAYADDSHDWSRISQIRRAS